MVSLNPKDWIRRDEEKEEDESSQNQRMRNQLEAEEVSMARIEKASEDMMKIIREISAETKSLRKFASRFPESHPINVEINRSAQSLEESNLELVGLKNKLFSSSRTVRYLVK